jgi:FkbM family methyltransferase
MRRIIDNIEKTARRFGIVFAPTWRRTQLDEESYMRRLLKYLDIDCVFDVGANVGQHAEKLRRYCDYSGLILSFEPNPAALPELMGAAAKDPLWKVFPVALGKERGTAEFQAYADSLLGSFLHFAAASPNAPKNMAQRTIKVQVDTLADCLPKLEREFGFKRPFLKLDTQGFDMQAAIGAGDRLKQFLGIQSEVTFSPIYEGAPMFSEVVEYYGAHGFVMSRLFPNNDVHFPKLVEMDVALIRADQIKQ